MYVTTSSFSLSGTRQRIQVKLDILGRSGYKSTISFLLLFHSSLSLLTHPFPPIIKMGSQNEISAPSGADVAPSSDEKTTAVVRTETEDLAKSELRIDDEAGVLAVRALENGPAEAEISKKVLRKIDMYILPFLCITYGKHPPSLERLPNSTNHHKGLQFLDKTSLGYSSVFGIIPDNHLVGQDYSWAS